MWLFGPGAVGMTRVGVGPTRIVCVARSGLSASTSTAAACGRVTSASPDAVNATSNGKPSTITRSPMLWTTRWPGGGAESRRRSSNARSMLSILAPAGGTGASRAARTTPSPTASGSGVGSARRAGRRRAAFPQQSRKRSMATANPSRRICDQRRPVTRRTSR
jgi:hypothetical protein